MFFINYTNMNRIKNFIDNHILLYWDKLFSKPNLDNGLIDTSNKKIQKDGDYVLSAFSFTGSDIIKKYGNFEAFMSEGEQQNITFEKMWCVSENGICNPTETVFNYFISLVNTGKASNEIKELVKIFRAFGLIVGDKCLVDTAYVASGSGTTRRGNSYKKVGNFVRHYGFIPKGAFPKYGKWRNWSELYHGEGVWINGNKVKKELLELGKKVAEHVDISYEWVSPNNIEKANERGVPGTSVGAWSYPNSKGIYRPVGIRFNHAINQPRQKTETRLIGDSYNPFKKHLSLDYPVGNGFLLTFKVKKPLKDFNEAEIAKLKARGWKYVLLINDTGKYKSGAYELLDNKLVSANIKTVVDEWVLEKKEKGELDGISSDDFKKLVNLF